MKAGISTPHDLPLRKVLHEAGAYAGIVSAANDSKMTNLNVSVVDYGMAIAEGYSANLWLAFLYNFQVDEYGQHQRLWINHTVSTMVPSRVL